MNEATRHAIRLAAERIAREGGHIGEIYMGSERGMFWWHNDVVEFVPNEGETEDVWEWARNWLDRLTESAR